MTTSNLYEACHEYLTSLNCTLWGRAFDINDQETRDDAAFWLERQVRAVIELRQEKGAAPLPGPGQESLPLDERRHAREVVPS